MQSPDPGRERRARDAKLQSVKAEIQDVNPPARERPAGAGAPSTQYLIIENFIPPEEKNKIMNRLVFDAEEDQWKFQPFVQADDSKSVQMKRRPTSAVGYKRPISQHARVAIAMGAHSRYRAENIMFLELDMTPPTTFHLDFLKPEQDLALQLGRDLLLDNASYRERTAAARVRKSRSWCQQPCGISSSSSMCSLNSGAQYLPHSQGATATSSHP
ncbi:hypothetical protein ANANG_G00114480 [Anguilla anguilla]|uniref:Uncharacterized protein n=1 Tax=Anguilla anguilla TaxID=7936 RepID=A0A9D3MCF5_ANGAN|nr:hypothetical protein ANANG_G00114480 [Anguilla anguilla]